jgi:hypothetical protein
LRACNNGPLIPSGDQGQHLNEAEVIASAVRLQPAVGPDPRHELSEIPAARPSPDRSNGSLGEAARRWRAYSIVASARGAENTAPVHADQGVDRQGLGPACSAPGRAQGRGSRQASRSFGRHCYRGLHTIDLRPAMSISAVGFSPLPLVAGGGKARCKFEIVACWMIRPLTVTRWLTCSSCPGYQRRSTFGGGARYAT